MLQCCGPATRLGAARARVCCRVCLPSCTDRRACVWGPRQHTHTHTHAATASVCMRVASTHTHTHTHTGEGDPGRQPAAGRRAQQQEAGPAQELQPAGRARGPARAGAQGRGRREKLCRRPRHGLRLCELCAERGRRQVRTRVCVCVCVCVCMCRVECCSQGGAAVARQLRRRGVASRAPSRFRARLPFRITAGPQTHTLSQVHPPGAERRGCAPHQGVCWVRARGTSMQRTHCMHTCARRMLLPPQAPAATQHTNTPTHQHTNTAIHTRQHARCARRRSSARLSRRRGSSTLTTSWRRQTASWLRAATWPWCAHPRSLRIACVCVGGGGMACAAFLSMLCGGRPPGGALSVAACGSRGGVLGAVAAAPPAALVYTCAAAVGRRRSHACAHACRRSRPRRWRWRRR
jgi:hypothetical protein